jgi:hypothetical protein
MWGIGGGHTKWWRDTEETVIHASGDPGAGSAWIILKPKLRAPLPRPEQLVRGRLLGLLHSTLDCKVSVISASTGYGKTTLLAQWRQAEEAEVPFAWISLDEQDNDPIRLWRHIVEALRRAVPEEEDFGADVLVGMSAAGQRFAGTSLSMLINEIAELPTRVVLALDGRLPDRAPSTKESRRGSPPGRSTTGASSASTVYTVVCC